MIEWIGKRLSLAIHERLLAEHGGSDGVRDENLLESALARPQQLFAYTQPVPDLADLAATLAYGLARNHPFVDGNKRTAYACCETFIELNEAELDATQEDKYLTVLAVAEGRLDQNAYAAWLRGHMRMRRPEASVQETPARYRSMLKPKAARAKRSAPGRDG